MRRFLGWMVKFGAAAMACCTVVGCASAPQYRYYTIDMQPRAQVDSPVRLSDVTIRVNEAIAKPEILIRTSPTRIEYYALDRWASGLEEQISEKLKTEFAEVPIDRPSIAIEGTLMAFEQADTPAGAEVRVKLEVHALNPIRELRNIDPRGPFSKLYEHSEPAGSASAEAAVEALSRATEAIAVELGKDLGYFMKRLSEN